MERAKLAVLAVVVLVGIALANLYAAIYVGNFRCGDQTHPDPESGSARSGYCDFFEDPDDQVTLLTGLLIYAPILIVLGGAAWAIARADGRLMARSVLAAVVWLLVFVLPATVLPG